MLYDDVQQAPEIQALKSDYEGQGLDFNLIYAQAYDKALNRVRDPTARAVIDVVVTLLRQELASCLAEKAKTPGTSRGGKLWRWLWNLFSKKKSA